MATPEQQRAYLESLPVRRDPTFTGDNPLSSIATVRQPDTSADEETIRAREAVIAMGYFPAADELIRAGGLDHTHCLQTALEVQRALSVPLERLAVVPHRPREIVAENHFTPRQANPFVRWLSRIHRQFLHFRMRHERALLRAERLEAENKLLKEAAKRLVDENRAYTRGVWSEGVQLLASPKWNPLAWSQGGGNRSVPHECANCGAGLGNHPSNWTGAIKCYNCHAVNSRRVTLYGDEIGKHIEAEEKRFDMLVHEGYDFKKSIKGGTS